MTRYVNGSVALDYSRENAAVRYPVREVRKLRVIEGAAPYASARQSTPLSPIAVTAIKCGIALVGAFIAAALARILIIGLAFGVASSNAVLNAELESARALGSELEVQQAVYGRSDRIVDIATSVYGMVPVQGVAYMDLSSAESSAVELEAAQETSSAIASTN